MFAVSDGEIRGEPAVTSSSTGAPSGSDTGPVRVLVTADTHIPDHARALPDGVIDEARRADLIIHAGDVTRAAVLDQLGGFGPVHAVLGNNDGPDVAAWGAQETLEIDIAGLAVAVIHDAGAAQGRPRRMRRRFPNADVVVFGHSHIPMDLEAQDEGLRLVNPGSPTWKRRQPSPTFAIIEFGRRIDVEIRSM
jgi:putative phosphoesterase